MRQATGRHCRSFKKADGHSNKKMPATKPGEISYRSNGPPSRMAYNVTVGETGMPGRWTDDQGTMEARALPAEQVLKNLDVTLKDGLGPGHVVVFTARDHRRRMQSTTLVLAGYPPLAANRQAPSQSVIIRKLPSRNRADTGVFDGARWRRRQLSREELAEGESPISDVLWAQFHILR